MNNRRDKLIDYQASLSTANANKSFSCSSKLDQTTTTLLPSMTTIDFLVHVESVRRTRLVQTDSIKDNVGRPANC
jgi:hypothetical protein